MRSFIAIGAAVAMFSAISANASELLLTSSAAKSSGQVVSLDFYNSEEAVGLQVNLAIPKGSKIDTSRFAKSLPAGFSALTNVVDNELIVLIVNESNKALPAGLISLGMLSTKGGEGSFSVISVEAVDASAKAVHVKSVNTDASK